MLPHYQQRWLCTDLPSLATRVASTIGKTVEKREAYADLITSATFIPAGNTLLAGAKDPATGLPVVLAPNCAVLGLVTDVSMEATINLSKVLWSSRTGIGFDLSGLEDPVKGLKTLSDANAAIDLGHRPQRGNMATLSATHPRVKEFIRCKDRPPIGEAGRGIYNFNISVSFEGPPDPEILKACADHAWKTGDPGVVFLDRGRTYGPSVVDPTHQLAPVVTCVPCGEQFMHAYETCTLGAINLASTRLAGPDQRIDVSALRRVVSQAVTFLDEVIDLLTYPDEKVKEVSLGARRIGLGVTGWANYLERIGVPYDSPEALTVARLLSDEISSAAERRSLELGALKGPCEYAPPYRNLSMTCIAPTGGITYLTGNEGYAIEPFFSEATSIPYQVHVAMAAAWQSRVHNAVSKTINLPVDATPEDVLGAYAYAYDAGLKGVSVYRDQCHLQQPKALDHSRCPECE